MKVLVCMDSSIYASEILSAISRRTWLEGTEFRLVTVLELSGIGESDNQMLHEAGSILSERVTFLEGRLKAPGVVKGEVLEGPAALMINRAAEEWCADLLIIGSHGDTGTRKSGIGSVAAAVVNNAPCSVEVVKLQGNRGKERQKVVSL